MSTADIPGALKLRDRMLDIANDPDLDEKAKLFAFCLLAYLTERRLHGRRSPKRSDWTKDVGMLMIGESEQLDVSFMDHTEVHDTAVYAVRSVIRNDIPRYVPPQGKTRCPALKARGPNAGHPCGKSVTSRWVDRDPETGEGTPVGYCRNHSHPSLDQWRRDRQLAWEANGKPQPPANRGGILARHFASNSWASLYHWADPSRAPQPEGKPATPPAPKLTLIQGGASSEGHNDETSDSSIMLRGS